MKKKTKAVVVAKPKKKSRRGRKKEKVQISVRIDKAVMDVAYEYMKRTGRRITDILERGVLLVMQEEGQASAVPIKLRFVVEHMDAELQRLVLEVAAVDRMVKGRELNPNEQFVAGYVRYAVELMRTWPGYAEALASLSQPSE